MSDELKACMASVLRMASDEGYGFIAFAVGDTPATPVILFRNFSGDSKQVSEIVRALADHLDHAKAANRVEPITLPQVN